MSIYLTTDASADLLDSDARNTDAAQQSFCAAWERAATWIGNAAGVEISADASGDEQLASAWRSRSLSALTDAGMDRDEAKDLLNDIWQSVHDCTHESRPGRWAADRAKCKARGSSLSRTLSRLSARA